ncbi:hypothetical protein APA44_21605 [Pseudomonas aeruginosa]|uniref:hypothetical protein n=1 Tax=Pseudomonas aeruginosa TaxID=287 RepID=UPI0009ACD2C7|nr:hypothetical protein [Pseudomonas aeruginosa]KSL08999.2 hypothetical protein APA44_21605 [Pseudomonas aeruginosa]MBH9340395.1 hypothetical protein [Pseudomonas aeruginosa]MBH9398253.1 hypothetical protein [Pseudomonas aeruginosa]HCF7143593.1 hypothetical protein [Pseudomonas aeruginosa]
MTDHAELRRLAKRADALHGTPSLEHVFAITKFREAVEPKAILALLDEIDGLRSRLEIDERTPHDGIACRDETIKVLDEKCDRLKAENDALRGALQAVEAEVDGNIRPLTRDLVNMVSGLKNGSHPNDIYEHCDEIERIIGAALEGATKR